MGARELLIDLARAGFTLEAAGDKLLIRPASRLTDELRSTIRTAKPELLAILSRPYKLSAAEGDAAHAVPWDDATIARFVARVALLMRRQFNATDADDLAERLHLRDVQLDDRALCVECAHLSGRVGAWHCESPRIAGVGHELPADMTTILQRCAGFDTALNATGEPPANRREPPRGEA